MAMRQNKDNCSDETKNTNIWEVVKDTCRYLANTIPMISMVLVALSCVNASQQGKMKKA